MVHYLTVQDVLWINHELAKKVNEYKYAQLEEAVYFQYGYGKSENVLKQASAFLEGFLKLRPFSSHNVATAFVCAVSFLEINGYSFGLPPEQVAPWIVNIAEKKANAFDTVSSYAQTGAAPVQLKPIVRTSVRDVIRRYESALAELPG